MKKTKGSRTIQPGGIPEYIKNCPKEAQTHLKEIRAAIREITPDAIETLSYFDMPGYSYEGYVYNGMFAWFSFKKPFVRLHVRPQAILKYKKDLENYTTSTAVVSFPLDKAIPRMLIKKLVKESIKDMKSIK